MPPLQLNRDNIPNPNELNETNDQLPNPEQRDPGFDEDDLSSYIMQRFQDDITDKEEFGWLDKRAYDVKAYYGLKDAYLSQWPWPNSSNFPQTLTPTLVDTAQSNIKASMWGSNNQVVKARGVGVEDIRTAPLLESIFNWQLTNEVDIDPIQDINVFRTFLHGTGILKVMQSFDPNQIKVVSVNIENFFCPIDAKGLQVDDTDHIFQIVPLSWSQLQYRKGLRVYKNPDEIVPGIGINKSLSQEQILTLKDRASGVDKEGRMRRETYFVLEGHLEYRPKSSSSGANPGQPTRAGGSPQELRVWMSPNGGKIQRVVRNEDNASDRKPIRPYADYHAYPYDDRFFSMSLPEKVRNVQEEIDYADKQYVDGLDRANMPAAFIDDTSNLNRKSIQRAPGGVYQKGKGNSIEWEPVPPAQIGYLERKRELWELGERLVGLNDITQGFADDPGRTLGETRLRTARGDLRFKSLFNRFDRGWKKTMDIFFYYDNKFMPRDKKVRVLGVDDFKSIEELFPSEDEKAFGIGVEGKFDYSLAGSPINEQEMDKENIKAWAREEILNPLAQIDEGNLWRIGEKRAEAYGIRNYETIITKPQGAKMISPEEAVQRVVSGQYNYEPRPGIDLQGYIVELQMFMRTETFAGLPQKGQMATVILFKRVMAMREAEELAQEQVRQMTQDQMGGQGGGTGEEGEAVRGGQGRVEV